MILPCTLLSWSSSFIALSKAEDLIVVSIATLRAGPCVFSLPSSLYAPYGSASSPSFPGVRISTTLSVYRLPVVSVFNSFILFSKSFSLAIRLCNSLNVFSPVSRVTDSINAFSSSDNSSKYTLEYAPCVSAFLFLTGAPWPLAFLLPFCPPLFLGLFSSASFHLSTHFHFRTFAESISKASAISVFFIKPSESKKSCFAFSLFSSFCLAKSKPPFVCFPGFRLSVLSESSHFCKFKFL